MRPNGALSACPTAHAARRQLGMGTPRPEARKLITEGKLPSPAASGRRPVADRAGARVEFGVLGPVEVRDRGRPLAIGGERERLVLAVLLLNANRMTGAGQLVDALWENPPPTAKAQLHNLISSLRRRL